MWLAAQGWGVQPGRSGGWVEAKGNAHEGRGRRCRRPLCQVDLLSFELASLLYFLEAAGPCAG